MSTVREFIENYVHGTLGKKTVQGGWSIMNWGNMDVLQFTSEKTRGHWRNNQFVEETIKTVERVAYRLPDGSVLSNANKLKLAGRKVAWGYAIYGWEEENEVQRWLTGAGAIPLPFTIFDEVEGADVRDFSWVVKPKPEQLDVLSNPRYEGDKPVPITRHFSGACLFAIDKEVFLYDIDRQELREHRIFNPFVTKLPRPAKSIRQAYDMLIPDEVRIAKRQLRVIKRQGEYYFVIHSRECPVSTPITDEERHFLKYPPSRYGFGLLSDDKNPEYTFMCDAHAPFGKDEPLDTPEKREFQEAAIRYRDVLNKYRESRVTSGVLTRRGGTTHTVEKFVKDADGTVYASGLVKHTGRAHGPLDLGTCWYRVYANTAADSWTISGDVD